MRRRVRVLRRLCWAPKLVCSTLWYPYRTYLNTKLIGTPEVHPRWAVSPGPPDPGLAKMGASILNPRIIEIFENSKMQNPKNQKFQEYLSGFMNSACSRRRNNHFGV